MDIHPVDEAIVNPVDEAMILPNAEAILKYDNDPVIHPDDDDDAILKYDENVRDNGSPLESGETKMIVDLYQHWLTEYQKMRDDSLLAVATKLRAEHYSDQKKIREELTAQLKEELAMTEKAMELKLAKMMEKELLEVRKRHGLEISRAKKTQWCNVCQNEAVLSCCWNTSYCCEKCQHNDWKIHKHVCQNSRV